MNTRAAMQRPTVRLRQDWERHAPSSEEDEGPMTPVSDDHGQPPVKQQRKTRARPEAKPAHRQPPVPPPKPSHKFLSELDSLYGTRSAKSGPELLNAPWAYSTRQAELEPEPLNDPRTYGAISEESLPQWPQAPRTHGHEFGNRARHRIFTLPGYRFVTLIVDWAFSLFGTILTLLQFPIAVLITLMIAYWLAQITFASFPIASLKLCGYPFISGLEVCQTSPPGTVHLDRRVKEGLDYTSKLEEMQTLGANSADLPHLLSMGEGGVRGMIVQLSVVDIPTRNVLMPLLQDYRDTVDRTIDGLSDWLSNIDRVVDHTILINTWAESQLQRIEERDSSLMTPINNIVNRVFGSTLGFLTTEEEVRREFFGLIEKVGTQVTKVVVEAQRHHGQLNELKAILDSIAIAALGDRETLQKEKMSQTSYWRWILRDYRNKMADFDSKMEMCAHFYDHTEKALLVLSTTQIKIQQMKSQLKALRDGLNDAPLMHDNGKPASLRLYIDALKGGVESLEATKKSTRIVKAEKMKKIDAAIKF